MECLTNPGIRKRIKSPTLTFRYPYRPWRTFRYAILTKYSTFLTTGDTEEGKENAEQVCKDHAFSVAKGRLNHR